MVTIIIMMIMTSVVIFNYNRFNESSLLNALAYDLSLTIRQAQVYGTAVRENISSSSPITTSSFNSFNSAYGVHFELKDVDGNNKIVLFADSVPQGFFGGEDFVLNTYALQRGIKVKEICTSIDCNALSLDITFTRPNPEARITIDGAPLSTTDKIDMAKIVLTNADGSITKSVVVYTTGQIAVQ